MLSNYCCAQMSNFKRLRLLGHTLWQGYDVRPVNTFCTFCSSNEGKSSIAPERLYHETIRFSKKIMVSAGVSMQGKTCIIFIDPQRTKVNGEYYVGLLRDKLIPECRRPAVLNLWAAAHWWAADICLVGREKVWEFRNFLDVSH